jgi:hypothetical protein
MTVATLNQKTKFLTSLDKYLPDDIKASFSLTILTWASILGTNLTNTDNGGSAGAGASDDDNTSNAGDADGEGDDNACEDESDADAAFALRVHVFTFAIEGRIHSEHDGFFKVDDFISEPSAIPPFTRDEIIAICNHLDGRGNLLYVCLMVCISTHANAQ